MGGNFRRGGSVSTAMEGDRVGRREARKKRAWWPTEDQVLSGIWGLTHLCGSARQCGLYLGSWQGNRMVGLVQVWKFCGIEKGQSAAAGKAWDKGAQEPRVGERDPVASVEMLPCPL